MEWKGDIVIASGLVHPIFYDPKSGIVKPQANLPKDIDGRKPSVLEMTCKSKDQCTKVFEECLGNFNKALGKLRH